MIGAIGLDRGLHMDFGSYAGYGIPYQVVTASTPRSTVTFEYDEDSDHVGYPIPASPLIEGGSDRHILMVDKDACRLYELFAAQTGRWRLDRGQRRDLGPALERAATGDAGRAPMPPACRSCPASSATTRSPPARSPTRCASRRTTRGRSYIYPARHQAGESASTSLPPMGLRVRLKAGYDTSRLSPQARAIAEALKRYGMILADNGSPWYITGASDPRFDDDVMHELDVITGRDLEVVDTTGLVNGP